MKIILSVVVVCLLISAQSVYANRAEAGIASDAQGRPCVYGPAHDECHDQFLERTANMTHLETAPLSKHPQADILSGLALGAHDSRTYCPQADHCDNWITMRGHGFINQTQDFIKGYVYGFCSNPKFTSGGGSEAEQAGFDCDQGPDGVWWVLPGDPEDNDTTYTTP